MKKTSKISAIVTAIAMSFVVMMCSMTAFAESITDTTSVGVPAYISIQVPDENGNLVQTAKIPLSNVSDTAISDAVTPRVMAAGALSSIYLELRMNGGAVPTQNYSMGGQRLAWLGGSTLDCYVLYLDANDNLVSSDDDITLTVTDTAWSTSSSNRVRTAYDYFGGGGVVFLSLQMPPPYGEDSGVSGMHYDYSCTLKIVSSTYGTLVNRNIFITSRIMK